MAKKKDILLSIGMIVKNEEKNLEKCLLALASLRKNVPCQLIITDTGSTDGTVAIAEKYADVVNHYAWNADFAAARNHGLAEAKGEWFMFLDADEVFYDTKDIEEFFVSDEYKNYDNASYKIRNFLRVSDENDFVEQYICRLFKLTKGRKFEGRIHEYIPMTENNAYLDSCVSHYSYANDLAQEEKTVKKERNLSVLKECIEEEPTNVRYKYLLAQEYKAAGDMDAFNALVSEAYETIKEDEKNPYFSYFLKYKAMMYKPAEQEVGIAMLQKRLKRRTKKQAWDLDLAAVLADLLFLHKDYKESLEACDKYLDLYRQYVNGELQKGVGFTEAPPNFIAESFKVALNLLKAKNYLLLEDYSNMAMELSNLSFTNMAKQELEEAIKLACFCVDGLKDVTLLAEKYAEVQDVEKKTIVANAIEDYASRSAENLKAVAAVFVYVEQDGTLLDMNDEFVILQDFRYALLVSRESAEGIILRYFQAEKYLPSDMCSEIVALAVIFGLASAEYVAWIEHDDVQFYTKKLFAIYGDVVPIIANNIAKNMDRVANTPTPILYFELCLTEIAIIRSGISDLNMLSEVFKFYLKAGYEYLSRIYREELLTTDGIINLGRSYRFIFWGTHALLFREKGEVNNAVACLKEAVQNYPIMGETVKKIAEVLLAETQKSESEQAREKLEFKYYAKKIKDKILEIVELGMRDQAIELLNTYKQINPADVEGINELERALGIDN